MDSRFQALREQLAKEIDAYKQLQQDIGKAQQSIKQFVQQQQECEMVKKELDLVEDGNNVFKLVGPVLVKQDLLEAQANMQKRLDFIAGELSRVEANLASTNDKRGKKEAEIMRLQGQLQQIQQAQASA